MKWYNLQDVKDYIKDNNINVELLSTEYEGSMKKLKFKCLDCGELFEKRFSDFNKGKHCQTCATKKMAKTKTFSYDKVIEIVNKNQPHLEILSKDYLNARSYASIRCKDCGYEFEIQWRKLTENSKGVKKCPCCSGQVLSDLNRVSTTRPDLMKYLINKDDGYTNSIGSRVVVKTRCPHCLTEKDLKITDLARKPYACRICSDGISKGEKFISNLLTQANINHITQARFDWSDNKVYDFYLPDFQAVCEVNGRQHYFENNYTKKSLEEEQENDKYKMEIALANGIKEYIVLPYLNIEGLILESKDKLKFIDFSLIDFDKVFKYVDIPNTRIVWDLYLEGNNITTISNITNISRKTVSRYMTLGKKLNLIIEREENNAKS